MEIFIPVLFSFLGSAVTGIVSVRLTIAKIGTDIKWLTKENERLGRTVNRAHRRIDELQGVK